MNCRTQLDYQRSIWRPEQNRSLPNALVPTHSDSALGCMVRGSIFGREKKVTFLQSSQTSPGAHPTSHSKNTIDYFNSVIVARA